MYRRNQIIYIGDGRTSLLEIKDFYVFDDSYISEHDKILVDDDGVEYNILDYREVRDHVCDRSLSEIETGFPMSSWRWQKRSAVKLDREAKIGQFLHIKRFDIDEWRNKQI